MGMRHDPVLFVLTAWLGGSALLGAGWASAQQGADGHGFGGGPEERLERLDDEFATREYDEIRRLRQRGEILPLESILQQARRQRPGRVLEGGLEREHGGRYIYNLELVDDKGQVWEMELDAATGEVLDNRQED